MLVDDAQEMQYYLVECNNYSKKNPELFGNITEMSQMLLLQILKHSNFR